MPVKYITRPVELYAHTYMVYQDTADHLLAEFDRILRALEGYHATLDHGTKPSQPVDSDPAARIDPTALSLAVPEEVGTDLDRRVQVIEARTNETKETTLRLQHLVETFDLAPQHRDVLLLGLLPTAKPASQELFAELQNDLSATQPTVGLVAALFSDTDAEFLAATRLVGPESPLRTNALISVGEPADARVHRTERPVFVEERVESYLLGHGGIDPALADVLEEVSPATTVDELRLEPALQDRLEALSAGPEGRRLYWHGPRGTGKRRAVEALFDGPFLRADLGATVEAGLLGRLRREALLLDRSLHLENVEAVVDGSASVNLDDVIETFASFERDLVVTGADEWTPDRAHMTRVDAIVEFPRPGFELRRAFWADHADDLPEALDPAVLAGVFELTQGELEAALATARSLADSAELTVTDVYDGCSAQSAGELGTLAEQLEPGATWADIELPPETMRGLRTVAAHVTHRGRIYAEWAFEERFSRGNGVVALFTGPSGTGKTMAAEIIAADVGMRLYKIDLSSVVSKYIGETEENLERLFTEAEHSNAILLFDEADAVFGDRAGVSDATDRYANVEVNYLLQRIESYDGVVLLTTNYESNIDTAFMRRIDHSVSFRRPSEAIRHAIWEGVFPDATPVDELDFDFLSQFEFTGGNIRTVAQTAAILAAASGEAVGMKHVVRGVQRELQKNGKMLDPQQFDSYREFLELD